MKVFLDEHGDVSIKRTEDSYPRYFTPEQARELRDALCKLDLGDGQQERVTENERCACPGRVINEHRSVCAVKSSRGTLKGIEK